MIKNLAQLISFFFHPLLIITYIFILLLLINPYAFGVSQIGEQKSMVYLLGVFATTFVIPIFAILIMRQLGMTVSETGDQRLDKIGPFLVAGIFYVFQYYNFYRLPDMPLAFKSAFLGVTIALFIAFFLTLFSDISIHAVGMGALVGAILVTMLLFNYTSIRIGNWLFSLYSVLFAAILLAGLVGSARTIIENPIPNDLYGGYLVGFATQLIALQILN